MIPIFTGISAPPKEEQKAQEVKRQIEDLSDKNATILTRTLGTDFSDFEASVVIGGQNTNNVYNQLITLREFSAVTPENDRVSRVQFVDESPVLVMAGYYEEDTIDIIEEELNSGKVKELIEMIEDEPTEEIPEPSDPITPTPPEDDEEFEAPETPQELIIRPPQKFDLVVNVDYRIEVSGIIEKKGKLERGDTASGGQAVGSVGASLGVDQDVFSFSGQISDVQAEQDMVLIINDEEYIFDSGANKIKKAKDFLGDIGEREEVEHIAENMRKETLNEGNSGNDKGFISGFSQKNIIISALILIAVYVFVSRESPEVVFRD